MPRGYSRRARRTSLHFGIFYALLFFCPISISHAFTDAPRNVSWAEPVDKSLNLYRVTPRLYRSAQFNKTQVAELESLGIRTSVDLREFHSDSAALKGSSIQPFRIRTNTWSIGDKTVIAALTAIRRAENDGPVLLHCQHGADRTGLIIAMYRIVYQDWTKDAALDELLHGGYGFHSTWKNIPKYLRRADVEKIGRAVDEELSKERPALTSLAKDKAAPSHSF